MKHKDEIILTGAYDNGKELTVHKDEEDDNIVLMVSDEKIYHCPNISLPKEQIKELIKFLEKHIR
jgi:hypothetical protein